MGLTRKQTRQNATPGFAIELKDDTELGLAILMADFGTHTAPVAVVTSIAEGREIAKSDMRCRMNDLERGGTPDCPEFYQVWAQGLEGEYRIAKKISL